MSEPAINVRFYYWRDDHRRPLITLCRVVTEQGQVGYGWAICSPRDNTHKDDIEVYDSMQRRWHTEPGGRTIAKGRALRALKKGKKKYPLSCAVYAYERPITRPEARQTLEACQALGLEALADDHLVTWLPVRMQPPALEQPHATP